MGVPVLEGTDVGRASAGSRHRFASEVLLKFRYLYMLPRGLAVFAGTTLTRVRPMARLRLIAALLFFALGLTAIPASIGPF